MDRRSESGKRHPVRTRIVTAVVAGALILGIGGIWYAEQKSQKAKETTEHTAENIEDSEENDTVTWQGKTWQYNKNISNYLIIGVDKREPVQTTVGSTDAGQADSLFLLTLDRKTDAITLISIPRDTMTQIETFGPDGKSLGKSVDHISLSYGYGDGGQESCKLTQTAVSDLMYGLPIQGYFAMNLDGITQLTKSVGSLTVTVPDDSLQEAHPEFAEGSEVTLTEDNTETFVRDRDVNVSQSAINRLKRQQVYLDAFSKKARECYEKDAGYGAKLYETLKPYTVTNISEDRLLDLFQIADKSDGYTSFTIPGEGIQGASYDEYQVDDQALYEKIIETFYQEVK